MKKIDKSIFLNIYNYKNPLFPFQIFIGGRGKGKTYSALEGANNKDIVTGRYIFLRRTSKELEMILDNEKKGEGMNPFKKLNSNNNTNYGLKAINPSLAGIYDRETDNESGRFLYKELVGYASALSIVAGLRGVDLSDCTDIIYDEFIPEKHVKAIGKDGAEFEALMNAYETFNRNRELEGFPPMYLWLLANSNDIYNAIFVGLGIVDDVEKMKREGKTDKYYKDRGLAIHILPDSDEFTAQKSKTALYKLTAGTRFEEMALHNNFAYNDFSLIGYKNIKGYQPLCHVDEMYIYKKKGSREYYVCHARGKCEGFDSSHEHEVKQFMQKYGLGLYPFYINGLITFETFDIKTRILDIIG